MQLTSDIDEGEVQRDCGQLAKTHPIASDFIVRRPGYDYPSCGGMARGGMPNAPPGRPLSWDGPPRRSPIHPSARASALPEKGSSAGARAGTVHQWEAQVAAFLNDKRSKDDVGEAWLSRMRWELCRLPSLLRRVGQPGSVRSPKDVTEESLRALRAGLPWETPTFAVHFQALRQFLRWGGNPIAGERPLWALPKSVPVHRRWVTKAQLVSLYRAARGVERVIVALEGLSGLRRVEVLRLRVKDVLVKEECLRILGKGRRGGKWRIIPLRGEVFRVLTTWIRNKRDDDKVVSLSKSGADAALQRAVRRAGLTRDGVKVSHHDLRRTFGRLANASGMSLVSLQGLYGHASPTLSSHYIGLDFDELKAALARLDSFLGPVAESRPPERAVSRPRTRLGPPRR